MGNAKDSGVLQAVNGFAFGGPAVERIGWAMTASGPALLVSIVGAPIVIAVNLDLADDEVAIGGPDAAGTRRLFRGRTNGDGTNSIETVAQPGTTGTQGNVAVNDAGVTVIAANAARRYLLVWNTGANTVNFFMAAAAGAFGAGMTVVAPAAGTISPIRLEYNGAVTAITSAGLTSRVSFAEVNN